MAPAESQRTRVPWPAAPVGQLREGELKQRDVVGGGVGAGIAGAQDPGERLAGGGLEAEQRVEAEAALVGARGVLLLGVRGEQRGVDVEDEAAGRLAAAPGSSAGGGAGVAHAREHALVEALQAAVGGGIGGDLAEEHALVSEGAEVAEAVAAVGEHHGEVAHHAAGLVTHGPGVHGEAADEAVREADGVGQTGEQGGAGARGQAGHVAEEFQRRQRRSSVHLHGDPPERGLRA